MVNEVRRRRKVLGEVGLREAGGSVVVLVTCIVAFAVEDDCEFACEDIGLELTDSWEQFFLSILFISIFIFPLFSIFHI